MVVVWRVFMLRGKLWEVEGGKRRERESSGERKGREGKENVGAPKK
jgi:hypothetical protein